MRSNKNLVLAAMVFAVATRFIVAVRWLPRGRLESVDDDEEFLTRAAAQRGTAIR